MSKIIKNDDGTEEEVFTKAELDAQLAEKDAHVKQKLDEFQTGKSAQELKDIEHKTALDEAKRIADEALALGRTSEERRVGSIKEFIMDQYTGGDAELKKKLTEGWDLINLPITGDEDIRKRIELAANAVGLTGPGSAGVVVPAHGGGMPPSFQKKTDKTVTEEENKAFREATGLA